MPTTESARSLAAKWTTRKEMRIKNGNPAVYDLPPNDGGGRYEVAGLNEKYNPDVLPRLVSLIKAERYDETWALAADAIAKDQDKILAWKLGMPFSAGAEVMLRDTIFHRGDGGAKKVLQIALCCEDDTNDDGTVDTVSIVETDGKIGPMTRGAYASRGCERAFLRALRNARELYEYRVPGYRGNFWPGFLNRWNDTLVYTLGLL